MVELHPVHRSEEKVLLDRLRTRIAGTEAFARVLIQQQRHQRKMRVQRQAAERRRQAEKEQLANEGKRREGKGAGMAQRKVTARMTKKPRKKRKVRAARTYLVDGTLKLQSGMTIVGPDGKLRTIAQVSPASTGVGTAAAAVPKDTGWIRD